MYTFGHIKGAYMKQVYQTLVLSLDHEGEKVERDVKTMVLS